LGWVDSSGNLTKTKWVQYTIGPGSSSTVWQLKRQSWVGPGNQTLEPTYVIGPGNVSQGEIIIGRNLVPGGNNTYCQKSNYTCDQFACVSSLTLQVTANVNSKVATNTYEVHPRAFSLWSP
jgi:hypothetical protein